MVVVVVVCGGWGERGGGGRWGKQVHFATLTFGRWARCNAGVSSSRSRHRWNLRLAWEKVWTRNVSIAAAVQLTFASWAYKLLSARQEGANVSGNPQWSSSWASNPGGEGTSCN